MHKLAGAKLTAFACLTLQINPHDACIDSQAIRNSLIASTTNAKYMSAATGPGGLNTGIHSRALAGYLGESLGEGCKAAHEQEVQGYRGLHKGPLHLDCHYPTAIYVPQLALVDLP